MKIENASKKKAEKHYEEHSQKPFFSRLCRYLCSGPVVPMVLEGEQVCGEGDKIYNIYKNI